MRLIDTIEFKVPGQNGEDGWSFDLTIPPLDVADDICEIFDALEAEHQVARLRLVNNPVVRDKYMSGKISREDIENDPTILMAIVDSGAMDEGETSTAIKNRLAELMRPLCGPPLNLELDERGGALTWDDVDRIDPVYAREVRYRAAEAVYSRVQGQAQGLAEKNSPSSSPSSTGGTDTSHGKSATPG